MFFFHIEDESDAVELNRTERSDDEVTSNISIQSDTCDNNQVRLNDGNGLPNKPAAEAVNTVIDGKFSM